MPQLTRSLFLHAAESLGVLAIAGFTILNTTYTIEIRHLARTMHEEEQTMQEKKTTWIDKLCNEQSVTTARLPMESEEAWCDRHDASVAFAKDRYGVKAE